MRRRALLAGLSAGVAGLAGCSTRLTDRRDDTDTVTPVDPPSESPTGTPGDSTGPGIEGSTVVDLETTQRTYALGSARYRSQDGATVRMAFTSTATPDGPATLEATLTNANPFPNTFRLDWTPPFGRPFSGIPHPPGEEDGGEHTYRVGLAFAPTANHDLVDDPPAVERASDGHWRLGGETTDWVPEQPRLGPKDTIRGEYAVVGRAEGVDLGRPVGVYEWSRRDGRAVRVGVWDTASPGPERQSRFAGESVPALPGEGETAWFHDATQGTASFVAPSAERTDLPARVRFTFVNRSAERTSCGHWQLYKLADGDWYHLGPYVQTGDCRVVEPGGTKVWTIRAANGEMAPCDATRYPFLGGGRYAAVAGYGHATAKSGALLHLDAPAVGVVPTGDVTTQRDGSTVTATSDRWRTAPDEEHRSRVELVLEPTSTADRALIAEQVMRRRYRGLRNSLAYVDQADRVVLRTDDRTADRALGHGDGGVTFRYDGQAFAATTANE